MIDDEIHAEVIANAAKQIRDLLTEFNSLLTDSMKLPDKEFTSIKMLSKMAGGFAHTARILTEAIADVDELQSN